ncbi:hypothetical protein [Ligilactobacillus salivarius]|uniref:hypothetical protein n=1 Tax=Ligilactobacillus salivarius TaxID=1624 RepID=UPI000BB03ED4|nr:hypothetical protein [Ligilactobacillus salivarius]PAY34208.1 hypothetical protein A8C54_01385 [Ligilactobacillus salivarius]PAY41165.1 hypothetical protein A8C34_00075 [Ligilactobacillus salivarius]PAY48778.1 hypothetical protein A8C55_11105 [Ligilactobacillus salivarius]
MLDYYLAISQMSLGKLITATLGIALIRMTYKIAKVIRKNNKTAVDEEYYYQKKNLQSPKKARLIQYLKIIMYSLIKIIILFYGQNVYG